jgi:outer membrane protein OmpA-like peptidoglycan-associated protein
MQSGARACATIILPFLLAALAFAGDATKPATNPQDNVTSDNAATAASGSPTDPPQSQPTPAPAPKPKKEASPSMRGQNTPGAELFLGYSYVRFNTDTVVAPPGGVSVSEHFDMIPGGTAQLTGNINNWFSLAADIAGYGVHDVGGVDGKLWTYLFGPRFYLSHGKFAPFVNTLVGGARLNSTLKIPVGDTVFFNRSFHQNTFAAVGGGGLDWNVSRHVGIRLVQAEYLYTGFTDNRDNRQNSLRLSGGIVWRFGFPSPPPVNHPPTASCSANPSTVHLDTTEVAVIRADANDPDGDPLSYTWTATGGSVDGTGPEVRWKPNGAAVGSYTVTAHVEDGRGGTANCTAEVHVEPRPNRPPTITCAASPATVRAGEKSTVTSTASDPDNDPLTYSYTASGGSVTGTGTTVQFDSTGLRAGTYTVICKVEDGRGGTADAKTTIEVQPPRELELRLALHSIYFPTAQPTVKDPNGGLVASQQQTLTALAEDFKKYLTFKPDAKLTLRGHTDPRGTPEYNLKLSDRRVGSTKNFLVQHGVPEGSIQTEGVGEEHQITEAEVKEMTQTDPQVTADQKATILKNLRVVTLAQNRRVDVVLSTTGQTSTRLYPFNAADAANLINPKGPAGGKAPIKKPGTTAPKKPAPKKPAATPGTKKK